MRKNVLFSKKQFCALIFCLSCSLSFAQDFSYGFLLGGVAKNITSTNEDFKTYSSRTWPKVTKFPLSIGLYGDYKFSEKAGLLTNLFYSETADGYENYTSRKASINLQPLIKFDVNGEYNKGFYVLGGARSTYVLNRDLEDNWKPDERDEVISDFYKPLNFGVNLGFGFSIGKYIGFQVIGDYGFAMLEEYKTNTIGAYGNIYLKLDQLF
ncbi:outer membrane beta-barrel protein [Mesonia aquimarina]|uniref:outer membrane beta-barrel protein n=1 Tax=Mesonia aquimarina TaxID=1504967 RepID=UPI000EF5DD25|nr:outer membrane beta-barrel protein [Mesonia aquimarina]